MSPQQRNPASLLQPANRRSDLILLRQSIKQFLLFCRRSNPRAHPKPQRHYEDHSFLPRHPTPRQGPRSFCTPKITPSSSCSRPSSASAKDERSAHPMKNNSSAHYLESSERVISNNKQARPIITTILFSDYSKRLVKRFIVNAECPRSA